MGLFGLSMSKTARTTQCGVLEHNHLITGESILNPLTKDEPEKEIRKDTPGILNLSGGTKSARS